MTDAPLNPIDPTLPNAALAEEPTPIATTGSIPSRIRRTLFRSPGDAVVTVIVGALTLYVIYRALLFVFRDPGRWEIVRANLKLFMVGRYPADELWRLVVVGAAVAFLFGVAIGAAGRARLIGDGEPARRIAPWRRVADLLVRLWPLVLGAVAVLSLTTTITPTLVIIGVVAVAVAGQLLGKHTPATIVVWILFVATVVAVLLVWLPDGPLKLVVAAVLVAAGAGAATIFPTPPAPVVLAAVIGGVATVGVKLAGTMPTRIVVVVVAVAVLALAVWRIRTTPATVGFWFVLVAIPLAITAVRFLTRTSGFDVWGGLFLNVFLALCGIVLSFPLGILLALGRRAGRPVGSPTGAVIAGVVLAAPFLLIVVRRGFDLSNTVNIALLVVAALLAVFGIRLGLSTSLPLVRAISVGYIELVRGMPLYVLLLIGAAALNFFLPVGVAPPSQVVRAIVVFTVFTSAYIAEIIRGGLQSLPRGQTEAAQALGLTPVKTTGLIIMPQALRAVIPGIVGQFISLFKDTTLAAAAMGFLDLMEVRGTALQQPEFRGGNYDALLLAFIAFVFWVFCITMSRESQRLEQKLGVGTR